MTDDLSIDNEALKLHGAFTCTAVPVQAEGLIDGHSWYFRARSGEFRFTVAIDPDDDPVAPEGDAFKVRGLDPSNGYMPLGEARALIESCAEQYHTAYRIYLNTREAFRNEQDSRNFWTVIAARGKE